MLARRFTPGSMHALWSLQLRPMTAWLTFIVTQLAWFLWAFPATYRCTHTPFRFESSLADGTMTRIVCLAPEFDVPCHSLGIARGEGFLTCRTLFHRPVRIVDEQLLGQRRCEAELGQMATYDPNDGCRCLLPYGKLVGGSYCAPRDLFCERLLGSGGIVIDPDGAWEFECGCRVPLRRDSATGKCRP